MQELVFAVEVRKVVFKIGFEVGFFDVWVNGGSTDWACVLSALVGADAGSVEQVVTI
jgi:hypothetical protein